MKTVQPAIGSLRYTNIALSAVAVMLTLLVADRFVGVTATGGMSVAQAAPEEMSERANALEQNKQMIAELGKAKKELTEQEGIRTGDEKNYARVLERLQKFRDNVVVHEKNVEALKRELLNLNR